MILIEKGRTNNQSHNAAKAWPWFEANYPVVASRLAPFKEDAEKRYDKGDYWWELRTCDYYSEFEKPKILWPGISAEVAAFAFDNEGYYGNDNTQFIVSSDKYLLGVINSRLTRLFLSNLCDKVQGGFYRLKMIYIEQIPIRTINFSDKNEKAQHDAIVKLVERMLELNQQAAKARTDQDAKNIARQIAATDKQIDRLVYELYDLTDEEIALVEATDKAA